MLEFDLVLALAVFKELRWRVGVTVSAIRAWRVVEASCEVRFPAAIDEVFTSCGGCGGARGGGMSFASRCVEEVCVFFVYNREARCEEVGEGTEGV